MAKIKNYILGLDVGVNSVGWAVIECNAEVITTKEGKKTITRTPVKLVDLNSRIFQEMVEAKTGVPKNQKRRTMRGMRRRTSRLKGRRSALIKYLQQLKMLPAKLDERFFNEVAHKFAQRVGKLKAIQKLDLPPRYRMNPMFMRAYALDGKLKPYEFSCALLQLQKRRGYKSNRGAKYDDFYEWMEQKYGEIKESAYPELAEEEDDDVAETDKEKEEDKKKVLGGIATLKKEMEESKSRTLAEFVLYRARQERQPLKRITGWVSHTNAEKPDSEISLYAERQLYKKEFEALWVAQAAHLQLKEKNKEKIEDIIFYQRPLVNPPPQEKRWRHLRYNDVGACSFFPKRKRAPKALLESQDYRMWQAISNIRVNGEKLPPDQKKSLAKYLSDPQNLNNRSRLTWKKVKEVLGSNINYKSSGDENKQDAQTGIIGNRTNHKLAEILGEQWHDYDEKKKGELVNILIWTTDKRDLYQVLVNKWQCSKGWEGTAFKLATLEDLEAGYMKHCRKVISNVLVRMRDKGEDYYDACEALGYHFQSESSKQKYLFPTDIPSIANPRVQRGLYEVRKIVNALIVKYGKPSSIHLELARDLKASKKNRKLIEWRQGKNRELNEEADKELSELVRAEKKFDQLTATRTGIFYWSAADRNKYKMWKEQKYDCLYCGRSISKNDLLDSAETEHIVPWSSFSQNYMNTVLACRTCNREKGDRTPYQAWQGTDKWDGIKTRLKTSGKDRAEKCNKYPELPMPKVRRILSEKEHTVDDEGFVQSQLNDTRYIAITGRNVLAKLGVKVGITKGGAAALLRDLWGLGEVLPRHPEDEIIYDKINERTGEIIEMGRAVTRREFEELEKTQNKEEKIISRYKADQAAQVKNRMDHRHHAIDAFIAAMTDHRTLMHLTTLNRLNRMQASEEAKEKDIKKVKEKIRFPQGWQGSKPLRKDVTDILVHSKIVSHQGKNKIWGALHEETVYGMASYIKLLQLDTRTATIKKLKRYLLNDDQTQGIDEEATWILRHAERETVGKWVKEQEPLKTKDRSLPLLNGKTLTAIRLAVRCYVINKPVADVLKLAKNEEWQEGDKSWIKDKEIHNQLHHWQKTHKNSESLKQALMEDPPTMKAANGAGNPIKSVRIARKFGRDSITKIGDNRIYQLGSNHHMEIFTNGKGDKESRNKA